MPHFEDVLTAAHYYARRGWRVIALHAVNDLGNCTCGRANCNSVGKHPVEARWQDTPPLSGPDIQALFEGENRNVGLATGHPSGFWVLDLDFDKPGTEERFRSLMADHGVEELPPTYAVK